MQLPEIFLNQMQALLRPDDFACFLASYNDNTVRGLRFNPLKVDAAFDSAELSPIRQGQVPWCSNGYYYNADARPAKSILFNAGLFYIQEPSAMCPVEVLKPEPGHKVLDLCAAPGGKSVQIAGHLMGGGLLVSNDASPSRSRALVKNIELLGVTNAIVTTEMPRKLTSRFPLFFDRILVDAPCSGEGMFRRDQELIKAYTANKPEACANIQAEILQDAAKMLKPGGRMVYSTCTFNTLENEGTIRGFLDSHPNFELVKIDHVTLGISSGMDGMPEVGRIFPHRAKGEGHFVALLAKKNAEDEYSDIEMRPLQNELMKERTHQPGKRIGKKQAKADARLAHAAKQKHMPAGKAGKSDKSSQSYVSEFQNFCEKYLRCGNFNKGAVIVAHGANLYLQAYPVDLSGIRVARSGWYLGECAKGRFVPSQALAMGLRKQDAVFSVELSADDAMRYLKGESLDAGSSNLTFHGLNASPENSPGKDLNFSPYIKMEFKSVPDAASLGLDCGQRKGELIYFHEKDKPWVMMCHHGFPLGWARLVQGRLKNYLPVGWAV